MPTDFQLYREMKLKFYFRFSFFFFLCSKTKKTNYDSVLVFCFRFMALKLIKLSLTRAQLSKHLDLRCFKMLVDESYRYTRGFEAIVDLSGV